MARFYPQCWARLQVVFDGFEGTDKPRLVQVQCKDATVTSTGYKESDKFSLTFDWRELPFHPDLIRACAVEIYMFDAGRGGVSDPAPFATDANLQILGLADTASIRLSADGRFVSMDGQDYTALLVGKVWEPGKRIPVGRPLDQVVQELVDVAAQADKTGRQFTVAFVDSGPIPVQGPASATITKKDVKPKTTGTGGRKVHKRGIPERSDSTYWDVIYKLCLSHGYICFVFGDKLIISPPRTLTEESADRSIRVAYGRNLASLEVERHIGNLSTPQIIATSAGNPPLEARWPTNARLASGAKQSVSRTGKITGLGTNREQVMRVTAPARIADLKELQDFARAYYEVVSRSESNIRCGTKALSDLDGRSLTPLRAGDPVRIQFDPFNEQDLSELGRGGRFAALLELGWDTDMARVVADNWDVVTDQFKRPFYCRQATKRFSIDDGLSVDIEGINYVDVERDDAG